MSDTEDRFIGNKKLWGPGPWQKEPDSLDWKDEKTGLQCRIRRGPMGGLCGYAGVSPTHPLFGLGFNDMVPMPDGWKEQALDVNKMDVVGLFFSSLGGELNNNALRLSLLFSIHGGLSFGNQMDESGDWFFGFDCGHSQDYLPTLDALIKYSHVLDSTSRSPGSSRLFDKKNYKTIKYVKTECASLANQLKGCESINFFPKLDLAKAKSK